MQGAYFVKFQGLFISILYMVSLRKNCLSLLIFNVGCSLYDFLVNATSITWLFVRNATGLTYDFRPLSYFEAVSIQTIV